ncbi:MAG TPA: hypothetical protein VFF79_17515 [Conexibacter sp.]|jgi:hypothetical protein|nr:hypothetical protein [Conexibacter sp.]
MPEPRVVVGGTPAALVTVDALGAADVPVRWLAPERGVGRGFAPIPRDGRTLQLGVRLLELGYEDDRTPPPLAAYRSGTSGHRPFTPLIRSWTEALAGERLREIAPPRVALDGALHDDYLFTVDLAGVPDALPAAERAAIADEAAIAAAALGDAGVLADDLGERSLADASRANHGATFHARLIEPLAGKFVPGGADAILADWRRKAWLPLFWPRTVHEAFAGTTPAFRPRRTFHELTPGGVGGLIDALGERIATYASVERIAVGGLAGVKPRDGGLRLAFEGGHVEDAARPALGVPAAELQAVLGIDAAVERLRTAIAWIEVDEDAVPDGTDLVHVLDPGNPVARVSGGSTTPAAGRRLLSVELRHDQADGTLAAAAIDGLRDAGLLKDGDPVSIHEGAMATLPLPNAATRARLTAAHAALTERALDAELLGGALAPGADSLNEQIVQGLRAAEALA